MKLYTYFRSSAAYRVRIEMMDAEGSSIFGAIDQEVAHYHGRSE
jgi:hypothetical protein